MATVEFLEEQARAVSDFRNKLTDWRTRRQSLERASESLRDQIDQAEQDARAAIVQGLEDDAREFLARKLVAQKRIAAREGELQQVQTQRDTLHADGCTVLSQAQAFNLSTNVSDPVERQTRMRLQEECRALKSELDRLWIEIEPDRILSAWKAELKAREAVTAVAGAPLGERNSRAIPQEVKIAVAARDGGRCRQCGSTQELHYDHVIPWSRGGANTVANIQLLCGPCNRRKGADDIPI